MLIFPPLHTVLVDAMESLIKAPDVGSAGGRRMRSRELIVWLTKQDAQTVQSWVHQVWEGTQVIPEDFQWMQLSAAIEVVARAGKGPDYYTAPDLEWARLAVSIYQYLLSQATPLDRMDIELRIMYLKGYLIMHFGSVDGDPLLDVNQIVAWFFHTLTLTREEVAHKMASVDILSDEELLRLRYLKERLSLLQFLSKKHLLPANEEIDIWLALRDTLP